MTRQQRSKQEYRAALGDRLDRFVESPCRVSEKHVKAILDDLCGRFGICLRPDDYDRVVADPPTDPMAFAELVSRLEGLGSVDCEDNLPVLELVLRAFEGAHDDSDSPRSR